MCVITHNKLCHNFLGMTKITELSCQVFFIRDIKYANSTFSFTLDNEGLITNITVSAAMINSGKDDFNFKGRHAFFEYPNYSNPSTNRD